MPKFNVNVPHEIDRTEAIEKLKSFMDGAKKDAPVELSDVEESWDDDGNLQFAFKAMGFRIAGEMVTQGKEISVTGNLPFAAMPFRGALETQLASKIREAIEA
jgi:hypothetical protein